MSIVAQRKEIPNAQAARKQEIEAQEVLISFLRRMAETVQMSVEEAIQALLKQDTKPAKALLVRETSVNAIECVIDEHAVRILIGRKLLEEEVRLVFATIKINNDLERMGDLAVSIAQRVISLSEMSPVEIPAELVAMAKPVQSMVSKSLGALLKQDLVSATEVLESEDLVDDYRNQVYARILKVMEKKPKQIQANFQLLLASRYLERIADHCTNIAEDVFYWVRGVDVRHGKGPRVSAHI